MRPIICSRWQSWIDKLKQYINVYLRQYDNRFSYVFQIFEAAYIKKKKKNLKRFLSRKVDLDV